MSYPCAMLNVSVAENNTNDQFAVGGLDGWVGRAPGACVWGRQRGSEGDEQRQDTQQEEDRQKGHTALHTSLYTTPPYQTSTHTCSALPCLALRCPADAG